MLVQVGGWAGAQGACESRRVQHLCSEDGSILEKSQRADQKTRGKPPSAGRTPELTASLEGRKDLKKQDAACVHGVRCDVDVAVLPRAGPRPDASPSTSLAALLCKWGSRS